MGRWSIATRSSSSRQAVTPAAFFLRRGGWLFRVVGQPEERIRVVVQKGIRG